MSRVVCLDRPVDIELRELQTRGIPYSQGQRQECEHYGNKPGLCSSSHPEDLEHLVL